MTDTKTSLLLAAILGTILSTQAADDGFQRSDTTAPTTKSKDEAEKDEATSPACPASNPYCNTNNIKPIATPNDQPGCPVENPSCNSSTTNKTGTKPSDPGTTEIQGPGTSQIQGSGTSAIQR